VPTVPGGCVGYPNNENLGQKILKNLLRIGIFELIAFLALLVILVGFWTGALNAKSATPLILSSFLSTFCGATYAFRLNLNKEADLRRDSQRAALQLALFTMARQYNSLVNLWQSVKDWEKRGDRAINMRALQAPSYEGLTQDFEQLAFLLETSNPMLLLSLTVEQDHFMQTMLAFDRRNKFYIDEVLPEVDKKNLNKKVMTLTEMQGAIGERIFKTIENDTNEMFTHLSMILSSLPVTANKLLDLAKAEYPNEKFIKIQYLTVEELGRRDSLGENPTSTKTKKTF
jgi:hypothetical protein